MTKKDLHQECKGYSTKEKQSMEHTTLEQNKRKKLMIVSIDIAKAF